MPSSDVITRPHEPSIGLFLIISPIASAENATKITINAAINVLITQDYTTHQKTLTSIKSKALSVTVVHKNSATYADALATAFNVIGYPESIEYANKNNIALMLVVEIDNEFKLMFSDEWYNLGL